MQPQRIKPSSRIAATAGRVALRYGPLVYNIESVDQNVNSVLGPTSALSTEWKGDLLGGVMVIKGAFADGAAMTAIPNYARLNRGGRRWSWNQGAVSPDIHGPGIRDVACATLAQRASEATLPLPRLRVGLGWGRE